MTREQCTQAVLFAKTQENLTFKQLADALGLDGKFLPYKKE